MKESRKDLILKLHSEVFPSFKLKIEKEFPKLFKKDNLVVGKWYKSGKCLFNYQKNSNVYGFFKDGIWTYKNWSWSFRDKNASLATDEEVKQALIKEAKKRGFKEGVNYKSMNNELSVLKAPFRYQEIKKNTLDIWGGYNIFKDGVWATIVEETITKEQAEKELGKTIID